MTPFKIKVANKTKQNSFFKIYFVVTLPLIALVIYHQNYPLYEFGEGNTETILIMILLMGPNLVLALKLRDTIREEEVFITNDEVITKFVGSFKFRDIQKYKVKKGYKESPEHINVKLATGQEINFTPAKWNFRNKKNLYLFGDFVEAFEEQMTTFKTNETL